MNDGIVTEKCPMCGQWLAFDTPAKTGRYFREETCRKCGTRWKVVLYRSVAGKYRFDWTSN